MDDGYSEIRFAKSVCGEVLIEIGVYLVTVGIKTDLRLS